MNSKSNTYNIITIAILITLIFVRIFKADTTNLINAVNFAGVITALLSLYFDTFDDCKSYEKINMFTGISIIIFLVFVAMEVLILFEVIDVSPLWNDIITLCALLVSLPSKLYKNILVKLLK